MERMSKFWPWGVKKRKVNSFSPTISTIHCALHLRRPSLKDHLYPLLTNSLPNKTSQTKGQWSLLFSSSMKSKTFSPLYSSWLMNHVKWSTIGSWFWLICAFIHLEKLFSINYILGIVMGVGITGIDKPYSFPFLPPNPCTHSVHSLKKTKLVKYLVKMWSYSVFQYKRSWFPQVLLSLGG